MSEADVVVRRDYTSAIRQPEIGSVEASGKTTMLSHTSMLCFAMVSLDQRSKVIVDDKIPAVFRDPYLHERTQKILLKQTITAPTSMRSRLTVPYMEIRRSVRWVPAWRWYRAEKLMCNKTRDLLGLELHWSLFMASQNGHHLLTREQCG